MTATKIRRCDHSAAADALNHSYWTDDQSDDGVLIGSDQTLQSLAEAVRSHRPVASGGRETLPHQVSTDRLDAQLDRLAHLHQNLADSVAAPILAEPTPPAKAVAGREAWSAVVILMLFIIAGFAWTAATLADKERQKDKLLAQLAQQQTAIESYQRQIKTLRFDLGQAEGKLKAIKSAESPRRR